MPTLKPTTSPDSRFNAFKSLMPSILMPCWCIILALSWEAELDISWLPSLRGEPRINAVYVLRSAVYAIKVDCPDRMW